MHQFRPVRAVRCVTLLAIVAATLAGCRESGPSSSSSGPTLVPLVTTDDAQTVGDAGTTATVAVQPSAPPGTTTSTTTTVPSTTTTESTTTTTTTTTTLPPTTTTTTLVTQGAIVMVANATDVQGAAGRLSDELRARGFTVADPTNSAGNEEYLEFSKVYIAPSGEAVGQSVAMLLGVPTAQLPVPAPIVGATAALGDATVLVMVGADRAHLPLEGR